MIKIDRGPAPVAIKVYATKNVKSLNGVTKITKAEQEIEKAMAFFTDPANYANEVKLTEKSFTFSVYKNPELVSALETTFGTKCAYCESRFAHVTPKDIEHFRPKSEIETGSGALRPGYFWLAGEWDNLLVSCPECNRARNHEVPGQAEKMRLGKATQFPLSDEGRRVRSRGPHADEDGVRLLLNPCLDQPEEHLTFDENGMIRARADAQGKPSRMGAVSITVYALQRKGLVEERLRVLNQLRFHLTQLGHLVKHHNLLKVLGAGATDLASNADQIRAVKDVLHAMFAPDAPFLAMLREWVRVSSQRGDFDNLLQFGINPTDMIQHTAR